MQFRRKKKPGCIAVFGSCNDNLIKQLCFLKCLGKLLF